MTLTPLPPFDQLTENTSVMYRDGTRPSEFHVLRTAREYTYRLLSVCDGALLTHRDDGRWYAGSSHRHDLFLYTPPKLVPLCPEDWPAGPIWLTRGTPASFNLVTQIGRCQVKCDNRIYSWRELMMDAFQWRWSTDRIHLYPCSKEEQ